MKHNKIIINFCPTGMIPTKELTPHVPISPQEIIEQTHEAYELGITIVHLHAREANGAPTYKSSVYRAIFEGVRKHCPDLVICGSTSGRDFPEFSKRSEVIELQPDMCSLTLSSLNFSRQASINSPDTIIQLVDKMNFYGVNPELECFDTGMVNYGLFLIKKGLLKGPYYWNLLLGNVAGAQANLSHIAAIINDIPKDHFISFAGLGEFQLPVNAMAIALGYGVRVGIEDNIWFDSKKIIKVRNLELIKRIHQLININEKDFFKPTEFGELGYYNRYNILNKVN